MKGFGFSCPRGVEGLNCCCVLNVSLVVSCFLPPVFPCFSRLRLIGALGEECTKGAKIKAETLVSAFKIGSGDWI